MSLKYAHLTAEEKLDSSVATLTILKGRLSGQFQRNVETVIDYLKDVKEEYVARAPFTSRDVT